MSGFDYWKQAHDALVTYHQGRISGNAVSVLNAKWRDYQAAVLAAEEATFAARCTARGDQ